MSPDRLGFDAPSDGTLSANDGFMPSKHLEDTILGMEGRLFTETWAERGNGRAQPTGSMINQLIERFAIMSHVFRHDIPLHGIVFREICHLINLLIGRLTSGNFTFRFHFPD